MAYKVAAVGFYLQFFSIFFFSLICSLPLKDLSFIFIWLFSDRSIGSMINIFVDDVYPYICRYT